MEQEPKVSILLLNYNGRRFTHLWTKLFELNYSNYEIIFIDNGSTDGSDTVFAEEIAPLYPHIRVKVVKIPTNVGYSKANNMGIRYANGDIVVLLSNDIEVERDWLRNMVELLQSSPNTAVAQSMMYSLYNKSKPDAMGNYINPIGLCLPFSPSTKVKSVFYSEGAVMFIRKRVIDEVGGLFDEDYFMLYEDIDFCWRVRLRGYDIQVVPTSRVYHARGGTVPGIIIKTQPLYVYTNTKNRLTTLTKNYSVKNVVKYLPLAIIFEISKGIWLLLKRNKKASVACFRGIIDFAKDFRRIARKRSYVQSLRRVSDKEITYHMVSLRESIRLCVQYAMSSL